MGRLTDSKLKAWLKQGRPVAGKADGAGLTFTIPGEAPQKATGFGGCAIGMPVDSTGFRWGAGGGSR